MNRIRLFILALSMMLIACSSTGSKDTIAKLRHMQIEIKEEKIEGGIEKAMTSYQRFLEETPDSAQTPEAIRRLADLKIEKEYGTFHPGMRVWRAETGMPALPAPQRAAHPEGGSVANAPPERVLPHIPAHHESDADFEKRTTRRQQVAA